MKVFKGIALPMTAVAILLIGVIVGSIVDSWRLSVVLAAAAAVIAGLWAVARMQGASRALREVRTELRHLRTESSQASAQLERLHAVALSSDGDNNKTRAGISDLDSRIASIADQQAELLAAVKRFQVSDNLETAIVQSNKEQSARIEALADEVADSKSLVARTKQQLNRTVRRQSETYGLLELLEGKLTARADYLVDEVQREMRKIRGQVAALSMRIDHSAERDVKASTATTPETGDFDLQRYLYYLSYHIPREIEAMDQLVRSFQPMSRVPLLGGWALSPTGTLDIVNAIAKQRPESVVECGSGTSTLWMAMALRDIGRGHVFSLEHDPTFADETRAALAEHGLSAYATVIDAPIVEHEVSGSLIEWYDVRELLGVQKVDMLVVDGPPEALGSLRGGAMTLLSSRLSDGAHVFLDDVNRTSERQLVQGWLDQYPEIENRKSSTPVQAHLVWMHSEQE